MLATWKLPAAVVIPIDHQREPEFSPPAQVDPEYRREVAVLYLAHLCGDLLLGRAPSLTTVFAADHLRLLGVRGKMLADFHGGTVLPAIKRQLSRMPAGVRESLGT